MAGSQGCPCGAIIHSLFAVSEEHLFKISVRWCCCSNLVLCRQKPWLCLTHLHPAYHSDPPNSRDLRAKHYKLFPHIVWWTNQQPLHWVKLRNTSLKLLSLIKPRICTYSRSSYVSALEFLMMLLCWSEAAYSSHCAPGQQFSCKPKGLWARGNHNLASQSPFPYLQSSSPLSRAWLSFSPCKCSCAGSSILCYSPLSNLSCYWCLCYSKSFIWVTTSLPACSDPSFSLLIFHRRAFLKEINLRNLLHPLLWSGCSAQPLSLGYRILKNYTPPQPLLDLLPL